MTALHFPADRVGRVTTPRPSPDLTRTGDSPMPHTDTLTVVHHDDTRTRYSDVRYELHRDGIRIWSADGEHTITDILMTHAYRQRPATD